LRKDPIMPLIYTNVHGKRTRGRPTKRRTDSVKKRIELRGLKEEDVQDVQVATTPTRQADLTRKNEYGRKT